MALCRCSGPRWSGWSMNLWGPHQYAGASVILRGPQYGMTLSYRRLSVGFVQSWYGASSLTFLFIYLYFLYFEIGAPPKKYWTKSDEFSGFDTGTWGPQKVRTPPWGIPGYATDGIPDKLLSFYCSLLFMWSSLFMIFIIYFQSGNGTGKSETKPIVAYLQTKWILRTFTESCNDLKRLLLHGFHAGITVRIKAHSESVLTFSPVTMFCALFRDLNGLRNIFMQLFSPRAMCNIGYLSSL